MWSGRRESLKKALKDPGAVADQELVRYGILIEPGMAVREGEQAALANSASIPDEWRAEMAKALNGESGLSPKTREGIKRLAMRALRGTNKVSRSRFQFLSENSALRRWELIREHLIYRKLGATS